MCCFYVCGQKLGITRKKNLGKLGPKTIYTNSTPNKYQTQRARAYEVTSFLSTDCELSTNPCSRFLYSLGPLEDWLKKLAKSRKTRIVVCPFLSINVFTITSRFVHLRSRVDLDSQKRIEE